MVRFSSDVDLLKWEPVLFRDLALPSQTLCQGTAGVLSGTSFSSANETFISRGVASGQVIYLQGEEIEGCFEVISVESETALMVSVVRSSAEEEAVAPPGDVRLQYRISTFDPQAEEVAYGLRQYFGIESEEGSEEGWGVLNPRVLRQAAVFGVLSAVFAGSACGDHENEGFWRKSLRYQKLFHTARSRSRLQIDTDSDQRANTYSSGGTVRLRRV